MQQYLCLNPDCLSEWHPSPTCPFPRTSNRPTRPLVYPMNSEIEAVAPFVFVLLLALGFLALVVLVIIF
ncbi:hypothetical protein ACWDOP_00345 [Nocardia sp. NPDC003693]